jgi:tetratricopeptide (TPR) repeat protein
MSTFPIASGTYYWMDYTGVDISWYRNILAPTSYFALDSQEDFFGGYDHGRRAGVINVADHHISPGKKLFTWGSGSFAGSWESNLTDDDGPYVELMAGVYTDNQPDFSWLQPYETRTFRQFWYPFREIGPVKRANTRAAVNLEIDGHRATVGACTTEAVRRATVTLTLGGRTLLERTVNLAPDAPFVEQVDLPPRTAAEDLLLRACTAQGDELIRYVPYRTEEKPLPEPATPPPPPTRIETTEELYLTGLHLHQYRHPTIDPDPYWKEALNRDPSDTRSNNALGLLHLRRGSFALAEEHFRKVIAGLTRRNYNPRDGEPAYNLGLALRFQDRLDEAYASFYKATWSYAWRTAAFYALAEIDCSRAAFATALQHLERSLLTDVQNLKARNLKAAILRRLGRVDEALALARETVALDPLDFWARNELALALQARDDAGADDERRTLYRLSRGDTQTILDIAFDYADAGLLQEADDLLAGLPDRPDGAHPMVLYARGAFAHRQGRDKDGLALSRRAAQSPPDYCFPARLQEMGILHHALETNPEDARAHYYLGNLLYDKRRYEEAIEHWEASCELDAGFAIPRRNLGIAYYNVRGNAEKAMDCYRIAFEKNPHDAHLLYEIDQLAKRMASPPAERLARIEEHSALAEQHDDLATEQITLYNLLGRHREALDAIASRRFHPWEGGSGRVARQYVTTHFLLGRAALENDEPNKALRHFDAALVFPENLGTGRHPVFTEDAHVEYLAGLAREVLGDHEGARACFERASEEQHRFSFATYYRALAMAKLGQEEASRDVLQELLDHSSERLQIEGETEFSTSIPAFTVFRDDPGRQIRAGHIFLIGLARLGLGQTARARSAFEEVLTLDPYHVEAQEELRRLETGGSVK